MQSERKEEFETVVSKETEPTKENRELNPEISTFLTELRETNLAFSEKATRFETFLRRRGDCSDIVRFDCDVCVDEYLMEGKKYMDLLGNLLGDKDYDDLSDQEDRYLVKSWITIYR